LAGRYQIGAARKEHAAILITFSGFPLFGAPDHPEGVRGDAGGVKRGSLKNKTLAGFREVRRVLLL
jgi:hypothetical protein